MQILSPEDFGALGGGADDAIPLQNWANALRDGGIGAAPNVGGYSTSQTITFMPSTNVAPVQGPKILGNLKLIGLPALPLNSDLLRVWNPTAVTTSQNFYHASFDSLELSDTAGTGVGLSLRGYWGKIGQIAGSNVQDVVQFPSFTFSGIPDEYESMCDLGDITGLNYRGYALNNQIGIGASITAHNVRGSIASLAGGLGCILASGSENITGCIAYSGLGPAVSMIRAGSGGGGHEIFMQGNGDVDAAQYGFRMEYGELVNITGHRMNVEPPGFSGAGSPSWPLVGYSFGKVGALGRLVDVNVHGLITIRPGVTAANIGTLFDFNNDYNIANLIVNMTIEDQVGFWAGLPLATRYKNISPYATMKIIENGVQVYSKP